MEDKDFNNEDKGKKKSNFNKKAFKFNTQTPQHKDGGEGGSGIDWDSFKFELPTQTKATPQTPTPTSSQDVKTKRFSFGADISTPNSPTPSVSATPNSPTPPESPQVSTPVNLQSNTATHPSLEPTHLFTEATVSNTATPNSPEPPESQQVSQQGFTATPNSPEPQVTTSSPQVPQQGFTTTPNSPTPPVSTPSTQVFTPDQSPVPPKSPSTTPDLYLLSGGDGLEELLLCILFRAMKMELRHMRNYSLTIAENYAPISQSGGYMNTTIANSKTGLFQYLILSEEWTKSSMSPLVRKLRMFRDCIDVRYNYIGIYHSYSVIQREQMYVLAFKDAPVRKDKCITLTLIDRWTLEMMWSAGLRDVQSYKKSVTGFKPGDYLLTSEGTLTPYDSMKLSWNQVVISYEETGDWVIPTCVKYVVPGVKGGPAIAEVSFTSFIHAASSWGLKTQKGYQTYSALHKVWREFNFPLNGSRQLIIPKEKYMPKLENMIPVFTKNFNRKRFKSYTLTDGSTMVVYMDDKELIIGTQTPNANHIALYSPEEASALCTHLSNESGSYGYTLEQNQVIVACIRNLTSTPNTPSLLSPDDDIPNHTYTIQPFLTPNKRRKWVGEKRYTYDGMDDKTRSDADWCTEVFCDEVADMVDSAGGFLEYADSVRSKYKPAVYTVEQFNQLRED